MPEPAPTNSAPTVSAMNACSLSQTIIATISAMPIAATTSTCVSCALSTGWTRSAAMRVSLVSGREAQGVEDGVGDGRGRGTDLDADHRLVGRGLLQRLELAGEQRRGHEVALARGKARGDQLAR